MDPTATEAAYMDILKGFNPYLHFQFPDLPEVIQGRIWQLCRGDLGCNEVMNGLAAIEAEVKRGEAPAAPTVVKTEWEKLTDDVIEYVRKRTNRLMEMGFSRERAREIAVAKPLACLEVMRHPYAKFCPGSPLRKRITKALKNAGYKGEELREYLKFVEEQRLITQRRNKAERRKQKGQQAAD